MNLYMPDNVIFTQNALKHKRGIKIYDFFSSQGIRPIIASSNALGHLIGGNTPGEKYAKAKKTLLVTVTMSKKLDTCRPSADFEFSLVKSCPGHCEYCYLQTSQGDLPYLRVFVNLEDIFDTINKYTAGRPGITTFEAASLGDPLALEHITGSVRETISFFGSHQKARLRIVTKYNNINSLKNITHNNNTRFRFSINTVHIIKSFEHNTPGLEERLDAASEMMALGYPTGFIIAPIMIYDDWEKDYNCMIDMLKQKLDGIEQSKPLSFELIQHRFTSASKERILQRFPSTLLDMDESQRLLKWGKFGKFKYVYKTDKSKYIKEFLSNTIKSNFPEAVIEYFT